MAKETNPLRRRSLAELRLDDCPLSAFVTNLPGEGRELLKLVTKVKARPEADLTYFSDEGFPLMYFYAHGVDMPIGDTSEYARQVRVILVDSEYQTVATLSQGIVGSLDDIINLAGFGPWTPPMVVRQVEKKSGKGRRVFTLEVLD